MSHSQQGDLSGFQGFSGISNHKKPPSRAHENDDELPLEIQFEGFTSFSQVAQDFQGEIWDLQDSSQAHGGLPTLVSAVPEFLYHIAARGFQVVEHQNEHDEEMGDRTRISRGPTVPPKWLVFTSKSALFSEYKEFCLPYRPYETQSAFSRTLRKHLPSLQDTRRQVKPHCTAHCFKWPPLDQAAAAALSHPNVLWDRGCMIAAHPDIQSSEYSIERTVAEENPVVVAASRAPRSRRKKSKLECEEEALHAANTPARSRGLGPSSTMRDALIDFLHYYARVVTDPELPNQAAQQQRIGGGVGLSRRGRGSGRRARTSRESSGRRFSGSVQAPLQPHPPVVHPLPTTQPHQRGQNRQQQQRQRDLMFMPSPPAGCPPPRTHDPSPQPTPVGVHAMWPSSSRSPWGNWGFFPPSYPFPPFDGSLGIGGFRSSLPQQPPTSVQVF